MLELNSTSEPLFRISQPPNVSVGCGLFALAAVCAFASAVALMVPKLLRRYARARQGDWLRMSLATDALQQLFSRPEAGAGALRNWGMAAFDRSGPLKRRVAALAMGTA